MPGEHPIYPPEAYHWGWWLVVAGCLLGIVLAGWWLGWTLRGLRPAPDGPDDLAGLKREAIAQLDQLAAEYAGGGCTEAVAVQRVSAIVRRFAGIASHGDADYQVAPELRRAAVKDPRLQPVADLVTWMEPAAFGGNAEPRLTDTVARAREVIDRWA